MSTTNLVAISKDTGMSYRKSVYVNVGTIIECRNKNSEYLDKSYIKICREYDNNRTITDIDITLNGIVTIYNQCSLYYQFYNNIYALSYLYYNIRESVKDAYNMIKSDDRFIKISNYIFDMIKDVIIDSKVCDFDLLEYDDDVFYSKYLAHVKRGVPRLIARVDKIVATNNIITDINPILWLYRQTANYAYKFLIYPNGGIVVSELPMCINFKDADDFGANSILEFCKDCCRYYREYKSSGIISKDIVNQYEDAVRKLVYNLK